MSDFVLHLRAGNTHAILGTGEALPVQDNINSIPACGYERISRADARRIFEAGYTLDDYKYSWSYPTSPAYYVLYGYVLAEDADTGAMYVMTTRAWEYGTERYNRIKHIPAITGEEVEVVAERYFFDGAYR